MNEKQREHLKNKLKKLQGRRRRTIFEPMIEHLLDLDERLTKLEKK